DAAADIDHEVGAAAEQRAGGMVRARADHVLERRRTHERKFRQRVHQANSANLRSSLPGLTRQSIHLRKVSLAKKMDARVKPAHDWLDESLNSSPMRSRGTRHRSG